MQGRPAQPRIVSDFTCVPVSRRSPRVRGHEAILGGAAYNRAMLHRLNALMAEFVAPALAERLTLLLNHVLAAEAVATTKLQAHSGARLALTLDNWPSLLPPPPVLAWRITPAGLLDWCGAAGVPAAELDLHVRLDAANPALLVARALAGEQPAVQIDGSAALAADVNWLLQNLRWDVAADLERLFGPTVAGPLHQLGRMLAGALRAALKGVAGLHSLRA
jgi:ubiquinone biosynthesis accessory factor UbiJ